MARPAIPAIPTSDPGLFDVLSSMKEQIETVRGVRNGAIELLPVDASARDVIDKVNEIINRVNV